MNRARMIEDLPGSGVFSVMPQYKYRAIINGNNYLPEVKKVQVLDLEPNHHWLIEVPSSDGGPYRLSVPLRELFNDPQEALKSLKPQYEKLIVLLADKMHFYVEQLNKCDKPAKVIE